VMIRNPPDAEGIVQLEHLWVLPGIRHGFTTRCGHLEDVVPTPIARLKQIHGTNVLVLPQEPEGRSEFFETNASLWPHADGLITNCPEITIAVAVADCLPVLIADPVARVIAAVHAGWRGLSTGVIENAIEMMASGFGTKPTDCVVGIGPSIGPCCYEVGPEVLAAFNSQGYGAEARVSIANGEQLRCNLGAVASAITQQLGVLQNNIANAEVCTKCNSDWLWSYRHDGDNAGRMLCGISLTRH